MTIEARARQQTRQQARHRASSFLTLVALCAAALLWAPVAGAAQIVVLDLKPAGGGARELALALNPLLVAELSKIDGMSVVSASDVRALLEHESNKAALGCDEASCMTDIAGSLGAELLATPTVSMVGRDVIITLTLIQVDGAKVVRRSTGKVRGKQNAPEAVAGAVHDLFREGLPRELQGPASMSRRGFKAALEGLLQAVLKPDNLEVAQASRRRVVLDLVNTELDYDAKPKMIMFQNALRRGSRLAERGHLGAKNATQAAHFKQARNMLDAMWRDHGRVEEIRERARARGMVPSARPLRFEAPEPPTEVPNPADFDRYWRSANAGRKVAVSFARAFNRGDVDGCLRLMTGDGNEQANRSRLTSAMALAKKRKTHLELLPKHAHTFKLQDRGVSTLKKQDETVVFFARWQADGVLDTERITLQKHDGKWRVRYW
jgi:hypothetical protein